MISAIGYATSHHCPLLCQEHQVAEHEEKQSRVLIDKESQDPNFCQIAHVFNNRHSEMIIYMSYMSFRTLPVSFGYTEMEITERRGCVVTVHSCLNQSILSQICQNFEVASWRQCFADQQVGFWEKKKKKDWTALWGLIMCISHTKG